MLSLIKTRQFTIDDLWKSGSATYSLSNTGGKSQEAEELNKLHCRFWKSNLLLFGMLDNEASDDRLDDKWELPPLK